MMTTDHLSILNDTIDRCCAVLKAEPKVVALYLLGSLAGREADSNSDIDLCVLLNTRDLEPTVARADDIASEVGSVLVGGRSPDSTTYSVLYDVSGRIIKVDYDYFSISQFPSVVSRSMSTRTYLSRRKLLFDRRGDAEQQFLTEHPPVRSQKESRSAWFMINAWSAIRMVRRGELLEAFDIINHMRDPHVTALLCRAFGVPFENFRRLETKLPPHIIDWLHRTIAMPRRDDVLRSLEELLNLYAHLWGVLGEPVCPQERHASTRMLAEIRETLSGVNQGSDAQRQGAGGTTVEACAESLDPTDPRLPDHEMGSPGGQECQ